MESIMKKFLITAATLVMLSGPSFAEASTETQDKMFEMRMQFMSMTNQMIDGQVAMLNQQMAMLTNFQKVLKQMMDNESQSHRAQ
jgi:hypothetical protein